MSPTGDLLVTSIFVGEVSSWACLGAFMCSHPQKRIEGKFPFLGHGSSGEKNMFSFLMRLLALRGDWPSVLKVTTKNVRLYINVSEVGVGVCFKENCHYILLNTSPVYSFSRACDVPFIQRYYQSNFLDMSTFLLFPMYFDISLSPSQDFVLCPATSMYSTSYIYLNHF